MSTMPELGAMSLKKISTSRLGSALPVLLALAAIWIYFGLTEPAFLSPRNFYYLFMQSSVVGTLAVGITIVLLIGDIDLSVAATSGVCAAILAVLTTNLGIPAPISCLAALSAGVCVGIFQGGNVSFSWYSILCGYFGRIVRISRIDAKNSRNSWRDQRPRSVCQGHHYYHIAHRIGLGCSSLVYRSLLLDSLAQSAKAQKTFLGK